jgi:hypothetical protein
MVEEGKNQNRFRSESAAAERRKKKKPPHAISV